MEMRNFDNLPGVAKAKSSGAMDEHARQEQSGEVTAEFANPNKNAAQMGVTPGMKIADFGAGSGAYTLALASLVGLGGKVYAVEVQQDLLKRIKNLAEKEGHKNVDVIWGDFERPNGSKLAEGCIDIVVISNTLFQLDDKRGALLEAHRTLRQEGTLVIIDWSESFKGMGPQPNDVVTKETAKRLCTDAGFMLSREFDAGSHHYGMIFKKSQKAGGGIEE